MDTSYNVDHYMGSPIDIVQNEIPVSNIPAHFTQFHECFVWQEDDIFEFKPENSDGVSYWYFNIHSTGILI